MAELRNDVGALRLSLALVAPERGGDRALATVAVESLDRRDGEWWPILRLPPLHAAVPALERLRAQLSELLRGDAEGFAWTPAPGASIGLQLGAAPGGAQLELGLDLGPYLADTAGAAPRADSDLALFRWRVLQPDLVVFADALGRELEALLR